MGSATNYDALPEGLRARWDAALKNDPNLRSVWETGKKPKRPQGGGDGDISGSGHLFWLGRSLVRLGGFTITEFGVLAEVWAFTSDGNDFSKNPKRALARVWGKLMKEKAAGSTSAPSAPAEAACASQSAAAKYRAWQRRRTTR